MLSRLQRILRHLQPNQQVGSSLLDSTTTSANSQGSRSLSSSLLSHRGVARFSEDDIVSLSPWSKDESSITCVRMNNPSKLNCMSIDMMLSLTDAINYINNDETLSKQTRVIVLSGNGRIFSSGHDLKQLLKARSREDNTNINNYETNNNNNNNNDNKNLDLNNIFDICCNLMLTVRNSSIPIICMTHGWCTAAGLQLACACDMITGTNSCKYSTPGINIGLFCTTPSVELSRVIGNKHCMEMLLTGNSINGQRAYQIGLLNRVTKEHNNGNIKDELKELEQITFDLAKDVAKQSKAVVKLGKKGFYQQYNMETLKESYKIASQCMVDNMYLKDCTEGIKSFLDKRKPKWVDQ